MVLGYLFIGLITGIITFFTAILLGTSVWSALLLYSVVGVLCTVLVPFAQLAIGALLGLITGWKVLSDECEPVAARTVTLRLIPRSDRATR